ncbi:hypothetical protein [Streptomyces lunaelactis]|nr:hypothetical protein [Streptomyces lunaelactis]NUK88339.1 hypothetical protein [Streptomyces lunaelactis]
MSKVPVASACQFAAFVLASGGGTWRTPMRGARWVWCRQELLLGSEFSYCRHRPRDGSYWLPRAVGRAGGYARADGGSPGDVKSPTTMWW